MNNSKLCLFFLLIIICTPFLYGQDTQDALVLFNEKKYKEAEEVCLAELEETPKNMESFVILGWALLAQKKYEEAVFYAEKAMEVSRYDSRNIYTAAQAYYYLGDNENALKYFEDYAQIAQINNKRLKYIYYYMGEIYIRLGEYSSADMAFSTALHYDNTIADWWARLGYAREMNENYEWALEAYENALKLEPDHTEATRGKIKVEQILG